MAGVLERLISRGVEGLVFGGLCGNIECIETVLKNLFLEYSRKCFGTSIVGIPYLDNISLTTLTKTT